ncbi:hypothetical protein ABLG96_10480 [Nakamurella sp. A5-74]|uniref:PQQ-binding-like beta-propeller repeat protein n=1 Tax=Nakamurella sp. A5-74 TaxID=3158264 RepID=A0AAU8DUI3_9ACTN
MSTKTGSTEFARRRRRDIVIAAAIALVAGVVAGTIYLTSDIRAVTSTEAPKTALPKNAASAPTSLKPLWTQPTDGTLGAVASARGVVVTTDEHGLIGRDPATGVQRWVYSRSNRDLCAVYSSDVTAGTQSSAGPGVRGIIAIYRHGNLCQEMVTLDPRTGARLYQRTFSGQLDGTLISGGPYAGWLGHDLFDVWRNPLIRTRQYGNQPASNEPNSARTGCTFLDAAITDRQFATVENCPQLSFTLRLVLNWPDPGDPSQDKDNGGTVYTSKPRTDIDTGATAARILGITPDRVAVLVNAPVTALVVYDADGTVVSRTPTAAPAGAFDTTGPTPRTTLDDVQYALLGTTLMALTTANRTVKVTTTPTTTTTAELLPTGSSSAAPTVTDEERDTPALAWQRNGVIGLPGTVSGNVLIPTATGIDVANRIEGTTVRNLTVSRPNEPTRVDLRVIGSNLVELRGGQVAVYGIVR